MRNLSIDYLKIILAYFVVLLHLEFLYSYYPELGFLLVNGLFRIAVPLFFIITGYYFANIKNKDDLVKWVKRVFIMYAVWMLFYTPFWLNILNIKETFITILTGYFALWYLISLIFSGIILFALRKFKPKILILILLSLFILGYALQQIGNLHYLSGFYDKLLNYFPIYRNFLFFGFPFLAIGFIINKTSFDKKYKPNLAIVIISIFLVFLETFINYTYINNKEPIDLLITLLFSPVLIFLYVKNISIIGNNKELANFSTAVFLIHPFAILLSNYFKIQQNVIFVLFVSTVLAYIITLINKKLKFLL